MPMRTVRREARRTLHFLFQITPRRQRCGGYSEKSLPSLSASLLSLNSLTISCSRQLKILLSVAFVMRGSP